MSLPVRECVLGSHATLTDGTKSHGADDLGLEIINEQVVGAALDGDGLSLHAAVDAAQHVEGPAQERRDVLAHFRFLLVGAQLQVQGDLRATRVILRTGARNAGFALAANNSKF